jgi:hypothetical protein
MRSEVTIEPRALPAHVAVEVQRILNGAARRLLVEQLKDKSSPGGNPGSDREGDVTAHAQP